MTPIACRVRRLQRLGLVVVATIVAALTGVRAPRGRAVSFGGIELEGMGRAVLTVEQTSPAPSEGTSVAMEVFSRMIYASGLSQFPQGLYVRSSFTVPSTRETGVLMIDVDRSGSAKEWQVGQSGFRARFYTLASADAHGTRFDGTPRGGSVTLDASVVGATRAGFRITGELTFAAPGPDATLGTADDEAYDVDLLLESVPPPEEITGQPAQPTPEPTGGICDPTWCWEDDGYYDGYWYGPGCGDTSVGYETTDGGCESDTVVDDPVIDGGGSTYDPSDPSTYTPDPTSDGGCSDGSTTDSGSSDSGCSGVDDSSSSTSSGCDSSTTDSSSSSGCSDSSSSSSGCDDGSSAGSGCASSGCEGDTLERAPVRQPSPIEGGLGWIAVVMFIGSLGAIARRRDDR